MVTRCHKFPQVGEPSKPLKVPSDVVRLQISPTHRAATFCPRCSSVFMGFFALKIWVKLAPPRRTGSSHLCVILLMASSAELPSFEHRAPGIVHDPARRLGRSLGGAGALHGCRTKLSGEGARGLPRVQQLLVEGHGEAVDVANPIWL